MTSSSGTCFLISPFRAGTRTARAKSIEKTAMRRTKVVSDTSLATKNSQRAASWRRENAARAYLADEIPCQDALP